MIEFGFEEDFPEEFSKLIITNMYAFQTVVNTSIDTNRRHFPNIKQVIFSILFTLLFLIGLITNLMVIIFYAKNKSLRKNSYFFINLSISDLLVLIICLPITITDLFSPDLWHFGVFYCRCFIICIV